MITVLVSVPLVTVVDPQVLLKATVKVVASEHVPLQFPAVGQLQPAVHEIELGVRLQLTEVKLLTTVSPPPVIVRLALLTPVTVIALLVDVVTSRIVFPAGVVKALRIPELANVKLVASTRVTVCPVEVAETAKVAPRSPVMVKFGTLETASLASGIVHVPIPLPVKLSVILPLMVPPPGNVQPVTSRTLWLEAQAENATVLHAAALARGINIFCIEI